MTSPARRLVIRGIVQGVGFRYAMMGQARLVGVTGWVRNRRDGTVEAIVSGAPEQTEAMIAWARIGPAGAVVEELIVEVASGDFTAFELLPTS